MAFTPLDVLGIEHDKDNDNKPRVRLKVRAIKPIEAYVNLSKLSAEELAPFEDLVGKRGMLPCRLGVMDNGMAFYVHTPQDGEPLELPSPVSKSVETSKTPAGVIPSPASLTK